VTFMGVVIILKKGVGILKMFNISSINRKYLVEAKELKTH